MKNNEYFQIDKNTPIIIYGAAAAGLKGYHSLKIKNGYNIVGFFDKRAKEIRQQCELPVWEIDDGIPFDKEDVIVAICVKNVFEHKKIAVMLNSRGFPNLLYKILSLNETEEKKYSPIDRNYQRIFNDNDPNLLYILEAIPKVNTLPLYIYEDYAFIEQHDSVVTVNFPLSEIYIRSSSGDRLLRNNGDLTNVLTLAPHISLFAYFSGHEGSYETYLDFCRFGARNAEIVYGEASGKIVQTNAWCANVLRNRRMVYDNMNLDLEINYSFFIKNAPFCKLSKDNHLIMQSAKHRAAFFIVSGKRYMPIKMSIDDYSQILNKSVVAELEEYLERTKTYELSVPLAHPYFFRYPSIMPSYYELFVYGAVREIAIAFCDCENINEIVVEDSLPDDGALARCLKKIGFNVRRICEKTNLSKLIDKLEHIENMHYQDDFISADIVCCLESDIKKIKNPELIKLFIILSSQNFDFDNPSFLRPKRLFETIWNGLKFSGYVCLNAGNEGR